MYISSSSPTIETNEIAQNSQNGIWMFGSSSQPYLYDNYIHANGIDGIRCYYSSAPSLFNNTIKSNGSNGIFAYYYSSPESQPGVGYNKIINNGTNGIYAYYNSNPFFGGGGWSGNNGGYNSIYSNTSYNVKAVTSCNVMVEHSWWNTTTPPFNTLAVGGSYIDYQPYEWNDPGGGSSLGKTIVSGSSSEFLDTDTNSVDFLFYLGMQLWLQQDIEGAINIYKIMVRNFPHTREARLGIVRIAYWYRKANIRGLSNYLSNLITEQGDAGLIGIAYDLLVDVFQYENDLTLMAQFEMGEPVDWTNSTVFETVGPGKPKILTIPLENSLGKNYPNPFNPTTIIPFNLLEASCVTITIYNILGREIVQFNMGRKQAGRHHISRDGKNDQNLPVPSGVYFYQISVLDNSGSIAYNKNQKMVLLR